MGLDMMTSTQTSDVIILDADEDEVVAIDAANDSFINDNNTSVEVMDLGNNSCYDGNDNNNQLLLVDSNSHGDSVQMNVQTNEQPVLQNDFDSQLTQLFSDLSESGAIVSENIHNSCGYYINGASGMRSLAAFLSKRGDIKDSVVMSVVLELLRRAGDSQEKCRSEGVVLRDSAAIDAFTKTSLLFTLFGWLQRDLMANTDHAIAILILQTMRVLPATVEQLGDKVGKFLGSVAKVGVKGLERTQNEEIIKLARTCKETWRAHFKAQDELNRKQRIVTGSTGEKKRRLSDDSSRSDCGEERRLGVTTEQSAKRRNVTPGVTEMPVPTTILASSSTTAAARPSSVSAATAAALRKRLSAAPLAKGSVSQRGLISSKETRTTPSIAGAVGSTSTEFVETTDIKIKRPVEEKISKAEGSNVTGSSGVVSGSTKSKKTFSIYDLMQRKEGNTESTPFSPNNRATDVASPPRSPSQDTGEIIEKPNRKVRFKPPDQLVDIREYWHAEGERNHKSSSVVDSAIMVLQLVDWNPPRKFELDPSNKEVGIASLQHYRQSAREKQAAAVRYISEREIPTDPFPPSVPPQASGRVNENGGGGVGGGHEADRDLSEEAIRIIRSWYTHMDLSPLPLVVNDEPRRIPFGSITSVWEDPVLRVASKGGGRQQVQVHSNTPTITQDGLLPIPPSIQIQNGSTSDLLSLLQQANGQPINILPQLLQPSAQSTVPPITPEPPVFSPPIYAPSTSGPNYHLDDHARYGNRQSLTAGNYEDRYADESRYTSHNIQSTRNTRPINKKKKQAHCRYWPSGCKRGERCPYLH